MNERIDVTLIVDSKNVKTVSTAVTAVCSASFLYLRVSTVVATIKLSCAAGNEGGLHGIIPWNLKPAPKLFVADTSHTKVVFRMVYTPLNE